MVMFSSYFPTAHHHFVSALAICPLRSICSHPLSLRPVLSFLLSLPSTHFLSLPLSLSHSPSLSLSLSLSLPSLCLYPIFRPQVFARARASRPCVIFFDEIDALCPRRGGPGGGGSEVTARVVNQMLTEMDGTEDRKGVFVIAATNRPGMFLCSSS